MKVNFTGEDLTPIHNLKNEYELAAHIMEKAAEFHKGYSHITNEEEKAKQRNDTLEKYLDKLNTHIGDKGKNGELIEACKNNINQVYAEASKLTDKDLKELKKKDMEELKKGPGFKEKIVEILKDILPSSLVKQVQDEKMKKIADKIHPDIKEALNKSGASVGGSTNTSGPTKKPEQDAGKSSSNIQR
jgi:hypothetical protein